MHKKHYKVFAAFLKRMRSEIDSRYFYSYICHEDVLNELELICVREFTKDDPAFDITKFKEEARS